jgi:Tfp pilus assembly protein PilO
VAAPSLKINTKSIAILIAIAVALFAGNVAIYLASSGALGKARAELTAREEQVENSRKIAKRLSESEQRYFDADNRLRVLEHSVSAAAYIPTLLKQLENTGKSVDLKVLAVRPRPAPLALVNSAAADKSDEPGVPRGATAAQAKPAPPKTYDTLYIDIEVEGDYWNTMSFLQRLTSFPKIMAVNSIQIMPTSRSCRAHSSPTLAVQMSVCAFVFPVDAGSTPQVTVKPLETSAGAVSGPQPTAENVEAQI